MPGFAGRAKPKALGVNVAGLTGDKRILQRGQTAQLIDAEWAEPKVLLVTGQASGVLPTWKLINGIDRAQLGTFELQAEQFSRVVIARSVQLSVTNVAAVDNVTVSAIVVPVDASLNIIDILGTDPTAPEGPPNVGDVVKITASTASVALGTTNYPSTSPFAPGHYAGATIYNFSPAGRNLYVALGDYPAVVDDTFTVKLQPGDYYELPFGYNGQLRGIWSGADAAGFALVSFTAFQS